MRTKRIATERSGLVWIIPFLCAIMILFGGAFWWLGWGSGDQNAADSLKNAAAALLSQRSLSQASASSQDKSSSKPDSMEITAGITHSKQGEYQDIIITSDKTVLKNKTVLGDITIADTVKNGVVTLENIVVRGKITVNGGAVINLRDITAIELVSQREGAGTRYNVSGKSAIHRLTAGNDVVIDESGLKSGYSGIKSVEPLDGKKLRRVVLKSGTIEQTLPSQSSKNESSK